MDPDNDDRRKKDAKVRRVKDKTGKVKRRPAKDKEPSPDEPRHKKGKSAATGADARQPATYNRLRKMPPTSAGLDFAPQVGLALVVRASVSKC